jgi:hypothetical protein
MITKLNYIKRNQFTKTKAKQHLGYIGQRPGRAKEKMERSLFGHGGELTHEQVLQMIETAPKNTYFWRLILSPDPNSEDKEKDLDMRDLTTEAVMWLERRLKREIPFIAAEHNDHTDKRHIHAILLIQRRGREMLITPQILSEFREAAGKEAFLQREARALAAGQERTAEAEIYREQSVEPSGGSPIPTAHTCGMCQRGTIQKRLNSRVYECDTCGYAVKNGVVLRRGREVAYELELSR